MTADADTTHSGKRLHALRRRFADRMILPGHPEFDTSRRVWNGMIDRRPAAIVRCATTDDVRFALDAAIRAGLPVTIRGGGHNVAGLAVADDAVLIDLSAMGAVEVDPRAGVIRAAGGARWADVDAAASPHGIATTGGLVSSTGVGGFTLGGGIGWLMRRQGTACDNLLAAEVVTADATVRQADAESEPDLFWALRGGGGNFGIVTSFTFRGLPLDGVVGGMLLYRLARARDVLPTFAALAADTSDSLTLLFALVKAPPGPPVPPDLRRAPVLAVAVCFAGDAGQAEPELRRVRRVAAPDADLIAPMPYRALQSMLDDGSEPGLRNYWRAGYASEVTASLADALVSAAESGPTPDAEVHLHQLGGAVARVPPGATAFAHRDARFLVNVLARWTDPADDARNVTWVRETWGSIAGELDHAYVNFLSAEGADRVRAAYGDRTFGRLAAIKARYDPGNVFWSNQNIPPRSASIRGPSASSES